MKKKCTSCGEEKPISGFYKFKRGVCGVRPACKECFSLANKEYRANHKEEARIYSRKYQIENAEKLAEHKAEYYQKNKSWIDKKNRQYAIDNRTDLAEWHKNYRKENAKEISKKKRISYLSNKESISEKGKAYYSNNSEKIKHRVNEYADKNKDKISAANKIHYDKHKSEIAKRGKQYRDDNKEHLKAQASRRYYKDPLPAKIRASKRRASKIKATPKWYSYGDVAPIYRTAKAMSVGGDVWHVDHIIPLTHPLVCGLHCKDNLQIIAAEKNLRKNNYFEVAA